MRRRKRISAGRIEAWRAALEFGKGERRRLAGLLAGLAAVMVIVNLPWMPTYERGLITGMLLVGALWAIAWALWVVSGLAFRLNGVWAEDATNETLRESAHVLATVPSLKLNMRDIDAIAVTRSSVLAVETKWTNTAIDSRLPTICHQAAAGARSLRHFVKGHELPPALVRPVVVVWGPGAEGLDLRTCSTSLGDVTVMPGRQLAEWLAATPQGLIGPDYAAKLGEYLDGRASQFDGTAVTAGPLLRRLGRAR